MTSAIFNQGLLSYIKASPTPFHAVANMVAMLRENNFSELAEAEEWHLDAGGRYYLTRNDSSVIAFVWGTDSPITSGIRLVGAHTDSPTLMVKPRPERTGNYLQLGVEVYGGALLNPWFDRDLSLAGRVVFRDKATGLMRNTLVDFRRPIATIPSLAIHLDREANNSRKVNPQTDILPVLLVDDSAKKTTLCEMLGAEIHDDSAGGENIEVLDYELCFYDAQEPAVIGVNGDFIAGARLDNLLSCYCGLQAIITAGNTQTSMLVCTDHEEVGSASACGAQGPMLQTLLERLVPDVSDRARCLAASLLVSADNAHGVHPNYADRHDSNHAPVLNRGPVLKINSNQRYATNAVSAALFRQWCERENVALQTFVTRTDLGCGSTIGPITATEIGVKTLDVGVPTFAMHSVRELAGSKDAFDLHRVMAAFFGHEGPIKL